MVSSAGAGLPNVGSRSQAVPNTPAAPARRVTPPARVSQPEPSKPRPQFKLPRLAMSLFHKCTTLPPEGQTISAEVESCDITLYNCKDKVYVYEARCMSCSGSGSARSSGRSRGSRGKLHNCLACHGLGIVRHHSTVHPDDTEGPGNSWTLNREAAPLAFSSDEGDD